MVPPDFFLRLPPAAAMLVLVSVLAPLAAAHALPRQTPPPTTIEHRELDVLPWPLETPPPAGFLPDDLLLLQPRQLNTVCGYVGGDPDLPATCSAGSHCAVDVQNSAVGCCPDSGACTTGVFTACVDARSGPQTDINPYVFTCRGADVCFENRFDGGFSQFGCGSSTAPPGSVAPEASGQPDVDLPTVSAALTAPATTLSEPTTLGTATSETTTSDPSSTASETTTGTGTATAGGDAHTTSADETSTASSSTQTDEAAAPDSNGRDGENVGAIVGGTVGGVVALAVLSTLAFIIWRRRKRNVRQGPGSEDPQYIRSPMVDTRHQFEPLARDVGGSRRQPPPRAFPASPEPSGSTTDADAPGTVSPYWASGPSGGGIASALGGSGPAEPDDMPLTRETQAPKMRTANDIQPGYDSHPPSTAGGASSIYSSEPTTYGLYPIPRRGTGGGVLWQQNREGRNTSWL